jgi:hypothetical protein
MISKVCEENLATMTLINKEASRHRGKELSIRKMKELGAQAEKEATDFFAAKTKQIHTMEQEDLSLTNARLQPPAPTFTAQWVPKLVPGFHLVQMELDGDCFYRSVSDQLFHDQGDFFMPFILFFVRMVDIFHSITNEWAKFDTKDMLFFYFFSHASPTSTT